MNTPMKNNMVALTQTNCWICEKPVKKHGLLVFLDGIGYEICKACTLFAVKVGQLNLEKYD